MRKTRCLGSVVIVLLSALVVASPAAADTKPALQSVTIQGDPFVGATLQAIAVVTGDPVPTFTYQWARCGTPAKPTDCKNLGPPTPSAAYTLVSDDLGHRLMVKVTAKNSAGGDDLKSEPTAVITAPPAPPPPTPPPSTPPPSTPPPSPVPTVPAPTPGSTFNSTLPTTTGGTPAPSGGTTVPGSATTPLAPAFPPAPYLRPFPVVRIKGASMPGGALIELLRVTAPRTAEVHVWCAGKRCPLRRLIVRAGRIRPLERFLPAGLAITIRVIRPGYIGKYVRFIVRSSAAPERHDACLLPTSGRPKRCPT